MNKTEMNEIISRKFQIPPEIFGQIKLDFNKIRFEPTTT